LEQIVVVDGWLEAHPEIDGFDLRPGVDLEQIVVVDGWLEAHPV
jgi:hypothetical protein